jgi:transcriptional regulator with XRE-family HTH domain
MTLRARFAAALVRERTKSGMTQAMLASKAEVTVGYIAALEGERRDPSFAVIERIAAALRVPSYRFFQ